MGSDVAVTAGTPARSEPALHAHAPRTGRKRIRPGGASPSGHAHTDLPSSPATGTSRGSSLFRASDVPVQDRPVGGVAAHGFHAALPAGKACLSIWGVRERGDPRPGGRISHDMRSGHPMTPPPILLLPTARQWVRGVRRASGVGVSSRPATRERLRPLPLLTVATRIEITARPIGERGRWHRPSRWAGRRRLLYSATWRSRSRRSVRRTQTSLDCVA